MILLRSKTRLILIAILVLTSWLRLHQLSSVPLGFSEDEASIGFNAYSILKTGKDEWGRFMPLSFEAFGDYKLPLPIYLRVPFVATLGLTELAVRLPAAILGILAVYLIFLAVKKMFQSELIALITALLLAISPWFTQLSRFDTSSVLAFDLVLLELIVILSDLKSIKKTALIVGTLAGALLTSPVVWLIAPFLSLYYLIREKRSASFYVLFIGIVLVMGLICRQSLNNFYIRNIFYKDIGYENSINKLRGYDNNAHLGKIGSLTQNKVWIGLDTLGKNYLKGFDVYYLVNGGVSKESFSASNFGKVYAIEILAFLVGLYYLFKLTNKGYLWLLLLLSPLPNVLQAKPDLSQTFLYLLIPFYIISSLGFVSIVQKARRFKFGIIILSVVMMTFSALVFFNYYFVNYPLESAKDWSFGYQQIAQTIQSNPSKKVVISDRLSQKPYIFTLFFSKFDPKIYQSISKDRGGYDFLATTAFDKYQYRSINWDSEKKDSGTLFIGFNSEIPDIACSKKEFFCLPSQTLPDQKTLIKYILVK